jgi:hypothetical protein
MYYSYIEIECVATSFSPARTDLALKLLKDWSQDLHIIFTYMQTKNPDLKRRATEILDVLFINTVHSGHWSHVQFGMRQKFFQQNDGTLSRIILTWLRQLQQFFLN